MGRFPHPFQQTGRYSLQTGFKPEVLPLSSKEGFGNSQRLWWKILFSCSLAIAFISRNSFIVLVKKKKIKRKNSEQTNNKREKKWASFQEQAAKQGPILIGLIFPHFSFYLFKKTRSSTERYCSLSLRIGQAIQKAICSLYHATLCMNPIGYSKSFNPGYSFITRWKNLLSEPGSHHFLSGRVEKYGHSLLYFIYYPVTQTVMC